MKKTPEKLIAQVNASMVIGMPLKAEDKTRLHACAEGRQSFAACRKDILDKYRNVAVG